MEVLILHLHALLLANLLCSNLGRPSLCEMLDILLNWNFTSSTSERENRFWNKLLKFLVPLCILVAGISPSWGRQFITFIQILVIPLLVHYLANIDNPQPRGARIMNQLGKISFSLYAFHWPILVYLNDNFLITDNPVLNSKLVLVPVVCLLTIGICSLLYLLVEKPSINLSRSFLKWASRN